jgi:beta-lactamase superfamily II metal-dependent hydrolase
MDKLRIRAYNVGFGDAILISVPDRTIESKRKLRHILIDVGSVKDDDGGPYFEPVIRDVLEVLGGEPLDLYVMTHEHMDHVKGLYCAAKKQQPPLELKVDCVWLTASSAPCYYLGHPEARKKRLEMEKTFQAIERFTKSLRATDEVIPTGIDALLFSNNPHSTKQCVDYLRKLAIKRKTYIYRGCNLTGTHPFLEATFNIWAPEENTVDYYNRFRPMILGVSTSGESRNLPMLNRPKPPRGVAPEDFDRLVESRRHGYVDNLLTIDAAANNTSIVFCLNWRGWKLLFSGDAEKRSWKTMEKHKLLEPVHFFKISHHGSSNGIPSPGLLDVLFRKKQNENRELKALISTYPGIYNNVPDKNTMRMLTERGVKIHYVHEESQPGGYIDIDFPAM